MVEHRRHDRLWRLVARRVGDRSFSGWTGVVCELVLEQVGVDGVAVAVRSSGRTQELVAVAGEWARRLEELQYTVGEGPSVEAYATGGPVLVSDLAAEEERWPGYADVASAAGVGAVFAFPLQEGAIRLGTLSLYRRRVGVLSADELADAAAFADLGTTALLTDAGNGSVEMAPWAREDAPGHYDDVNVASGMLAAELRVSIEDAFMRLRAHAFSHGQSLLDVAGAVLRRQLGAEVFRD